MFFFQLLCCAMSRAGYASDVVGGLYTGLPCVRERQDWLSLGVPSSYQASQPNRTLPRIHRIAGLRRFGFATDQSDCPLSSRTGRSVARCSPSAPRPFPRCSLPSLAPVPRSSLRLAARRRCVPRPTDPAARGRSARTRLAPLSTASIPSRRSHPVPSHGSNINCGELILGELILR